MIDDESELSAAAPDPSSDGELLLYDFFKHLTSLVLLTLGGVLVVSQAADRSDVKPALLIGVLVLISAGGVCSFAGASEIVKKRYTGASTHNIDFYRKAAPILLSIGVGMFLGIFVDSLD